MDKFQNAIRHQRSIVRIVVRKAGIGEQVSLALINEFFAAGASASAPSGESLYGCRIAPRILRIEVPISTIWTISSCGLR